MKNLIPVLSKKEKQELIAYYTVWEKHAGEFSNKLTKNLKGHPVFGKLINNIPNEISAARNKLSGELQKDAIINANWQPYIEYQIEQGISYARMDLDFTSWYELIVQVKNYIRPLLFREYGNGEEFLSSLNGMNRFMDISMSIIGEAYLQEKQEIINADREKIKKLNEELEKKVIERTSELQKSKDTFFELFNYNPASLTIRRADDGRIINYNNAFLRLFEFPPEEEIIGKTSAELNLQDNSGRIEDIVNMLKEKEILNREICVRNKYGNLIWVSSSILKIDIDNTHCFLTVSIDIAEQKKAEEHLQEVNKELEAFTYSVSHDLRAPLRAINGFAKILQEDYSQKLDTEGASSLNTILNNSKKMGELIDALLAFSRLGRKSLTTSEINMTNLVKCILEEVIPNSNEIDFVINDLLPSEGDQLLIKQVWVNLISNAIKYSKPTSKISIEIGSYYKENLAVYYVKDKGVGFDMQYYDKLFGVFQRLHSQEEFEGIGVGLAIVKKIVHRHNGTVWATSKLNKGSCFYFSLPAVKTGLSKINI